MDPSGDPSGAGMGGGSPPDPRLIPAPPTSGTQSAAASFAGVSVALSVLSFMLFSARVWTKSFPAFRMGTDDYIIMIAYVLLLTNTILLCIPIPYAFGADPSTMTLQDSIDGNRLATFAQLIWAWSMAAVKISVTTMLLRLEQKRLLRHLLWAMIGMQILVAIYTTIAILVQCIPLHASWDLMNLVEDKKCWSTQAIRTSSICVSSFHVVTDVIIALLPAAFLKDVQIPLRERVVLAVLMGLGIFASAASIVKAVMAAQLGKTGDYQKEVITVSMWSAIEEHIAFIAACIPCLRKPFQSILGRLGFSSSAGGGTSNNKGPGGGSSGFKRMYADHSGMSEDASHGGNAIHMKSMALATRDDRSEENILGGAQSQSETTLKPGEIWMTTEVHLEAGDWPNNNKSRETIGGTSV